MPFLSLVTLPSASTFLSGAGDWSSPIFTDILPFIYFAVGVTLAFYLAKFLIHVVGSLFHR